MKNIVHVIKHAGFQHFRAYTAGVIWKIQQTENASRVLFLE